MPFPVEAVLPEFLRHLAEAPNAVLIAPPGAGKTTIVPPALLDQPWCGGKILLLSPRRIAARMAAERISELTGTKTGDLVGYATRMDARQSAATRLLVLTEGIFRNMIIADPELSGISAVIFDEVHERSLDSDFGLALALEAQSAFRPDLRLIAMSATLDGDRFSKLMALDGHAAPLVESAGKSWPLNLRHIGRRAELPVEQDIASAIRLALREEEGDILAFLPGLREIERTADQLSGLPDMIVVHMLHGGLEPAAQRAAIMPDGQGRRKIILATNIAETSLTIDGVRVVVDSGLARRARYDRAAGISRLVTEKASLSAVTQRAGRAARQGAGVAVRLWEEAANGGLPPFDPPEILETNLTPLVLDCAAWGENDPSRLRWLDPPPVSSLQEARHALANFGMIDGKGRVTPHGTVISRLPLPPHLAHMLVRAAERGQAIMAAELALLVQERGLGGMGEDLELRRERFGKDNGRRAQAARNLAARLAKLAENVAVVQPDAPALSVAGLLALAFPDFVAKRRDAKGENWISVSGRGLRLDPDSSLARAGWLAVADMQGAASAARILAAAPIDAVEVETLFADRISTSLSVEYDRANDRVQVRERKKLGAIILAEGAVARPDADAISALLLDVVRAEGLEILPWSGAAILLRRRAVFAGFDQLSDAALMDGLEDWLLPVLSGVTRIGNIRSEMLAHALDNLLGYDGRRGVDRIAPSAFTSPAGTRHDIDYAAPAGPTIELRVQALFGLDSHPTVGADNIPLVLSLTSPAGRPIQTTRDLPAFWRGSWHDVARDMRGRYPKHNWPDRPWEAAASLKTKKAQSRDS